MDGRQFVREKARPEYYQVVIQDAVNDLSVPWHLMTKEYNDAIKATLDPKTGVYLLTIIDSIEDGRLWRAAVNTLRKSFDHVEILDPSGFEEDPRTGKISGRHVYVIYAADHPIPLAEIEANAKEWDRQRAAALRAAAGAAVVVPADGEPDPTGLNVVELAPIKLMGTWLYGRPAYSRVLDQARLERHMKAGKKIILTDQYAPVDNLMTDVFRNR